MQLHKNLQTADAAVIQSQQDSLISARFQCQGVYVQLVQHTFGKTGNEIAHDADTHHGGDVHTGKAHGQIVHRMGPHFLKNAIRAYYPILFLTILL